MKFPTKEDGVLVYAETDVGTILWAWGDFNPANLPGGCWRMWLEGQERVWWQDIDPRIVANAVYPAEVVMVAEECLLRNVRRSTNLT